MDEVRMLEPDEMPLPSIGQLLQALDWVSIHLRRMQANSDEVELEESAELARVLASTDSG
jgi:hypothetical protein